MYQCKIKLCGLSRFSDILAVNQIAPDYIGFVFAPSSRQITPDRAAQLKRELDERIQAVGVFVDAPAGDILKLVCSEEGRGRVIDVIQLHGGEDEAYIRFLKEHTDRPVIKAVRARNREQIQAAQELPCDYLLLDTYVKGRQGGSGMQFDWNMIPHISKPYFLAGGIHIGNLEEAVSHMPYCIDVSSAVETEGRKDREKMREMAEAVREIKWPA